MLRIQTVVIADGLYGAYDPYTVPVTVRNSAAVLGRIGHDCESTVALAASFQVFLSPLYSLSKFISEYKSGQSHYCCFD